MKSSDQKGRMPSKAPSKAKADRSWKRKKTRLPNSSDMSEEHEFYATSGIRDTHEGHIGMSPPPQTPRSSATHNTKEDVSKKSALATKRSSFPLASTPPGEYNTVKIRDGMVGFDLELWWRRSVASTNFTVLFAMLLLAIAIAHFVAGIVFISQHFSHKTINPYLCDTLECDKAAKWVSATMNTSVDPCDNFYEFVCGNYVEPEGEDPSFTKLLFGPNFKIEFGSDSYLAKLLKTYKNNEKKDQAIAYYQRCLDYRKRKIYGLGALKKAFGNVFGTTDLSKFESSPAASNLEEVGVNLFHLMGHGVYLSMAFFAYPYIQIWPPSDWLFQLSTSSPTSADSIFVHKIITKIVSEMGTPTNTSIVSELVEGVRVFSDITTILIQDMELYKFDKNNFDMFQQDVLSKLAGYCPPLGVSLDMFKVYDKFTGEDSSKYVTFFSDTSERFFHGLNLCFKEDPSKFKPKTTINHPKTAFVGIWVYGLFLEFLQYMDPNILTYWGIGLEGVSYGQQLAIILERPPDYQCLVSMWSALGYLPSIRFLESAKGDDLHILQETEELIGRLFETTRQKWSTLPETTDLSIKFVGETLFSRGLKTNLMMPLEGGQVDYSHDILAFTEDHLGNTMNAMEYTIQKAKQTWIGSTNIVASSKWWGRGTVPSRVSRDLLQELLSIQFPMIHGARFLSERGAAKADKWVTFLGRKPSNYILFPMTLINEPHSEESLALHHAGTTVKIIRSFMSLLSEALYAFDGKYETNGSYTGSVIEQILDVDLHSPQPNELCVALGYHPGGGYRRAYNAQFFKTKWFDFNLKEHLYSAITLKIALSLLRDERKAMQNTAPKFLLNDKERRLRFQQVLPHRLVDFSEEQLFFMVFVRHLCKGSWKTHEEFRRFRYALEGDVLNVLMTMKEFSDVWQCPDRSYMNLGDLRCLKWTP